MNAMELFSLKGRVCVVTGVAQPKGLGITMCRALGDAGCRLVISDRTELVFSAAETLKSEGYAVTALVADTASQSGAEDVRDAALAAYGTVDILLNNAAFGYTGKAEETPFDTYKDVIVNNMGGYFIMSQVIGKVMIEKGKGSIINMSSKSGFVPDTPNLQSAYNSSKAGITMLTKSLAMEWARHGVRVNAIAPGIMITEPVEKGEWEWARQTWEDHIPMGRYGRADELGGAVIYLASDASSYVTGCTIHADGGYVCI